MEAQRSGRPPLSPALLAGGVILVAINLRPAAASIGPVLDRIQSDTGLSSGWAGALATLPVLCFGLLAPLAPPLARRLGVHTTIAVAMVALVAGMLLRLVPGDVFLFAGTALAGAAIATANVLLPVIVRRDFPDRTGSAMALYTTSLIGFAALSAGTTVPLANGLGGGWRPGLGIWAAPAVVAALAWLPALVRHGARRDARGDAEGGSGVRTPTVRPLLRQPLAWQVTLFFAVQPGGFYATLAWLPDIFRSHGASDSRAGFLLSLSILVGLLTSTTLPGLATRMRDQRWLVVVCCAVWAAGLTGIIVAPMSAPYLWAVLLGLGQNSTFPLALMLIVLRGGSVATTEGLSTLSQSVGYALAAIFPLAVGAMHGAAGSWTPPLILLLALLVPQLAFGLAAGRNRVLTAG
ncbi:MAG TPA: MFS transporter [Solirubrobacteraceae bacterium]|nr:MFS transporter [Solirubrobacteraceae bacterium]